MLDYNTSMQAIHTSSDKIFWYFVTGVLTNVIAIISLISTIWYNRKQLEASNKKHEKIINHSIKMLEANHDFLKRSFTTAFIRDCVNELNKAREKLDDLTAPEKEIIKDAAGNYINFTTWREANKKLLPATLHQWVCEEDGQNNYKKVAKADREPCITTKEKEEIVITIIYIINIYEQMGVALKNNVIDKEILSNTFGAPIKRNYELYQAYIDHRIEKHGDENFGRYFKWAYDELHKQEKDIQRKNASEEIIS